MTRLLYFLLFTCSSHFLFAQYKITDKHTVTCSSIKDQENTGTCWSFATSSFLESEIMRIHDKQVDLSEMYSVYATYQDKARNYLLRQGKANFSQGSLSHDVINALAHVGVVPESAFSGRPEGMDEHDHGELVAGLKGMLNGLNKRKHLSPRWPQAVSSFLDVYLGTAPANFMYEGKSYTPKSFAAMLQLNPDDYVSLTSYTHRPFYRSFVLELPDNYSNGAYQNIPMDELEAIVDEAIKNGFSVAWDGDVSEATFNHRQGLALVPTNEDRQDLWDTPNKELDITQAMRQATFESKSTTDDHLMHLVGIAYDQKGTKYYKIKNSWGADNKYKGYLYLSRSYFLLKTVGILLHRDGIPKNIQQKFQ